MKRTTTEKVRKKFQLEDLYQQAIKALKKKEKEKAHKLLSEVISIDPAFKEASRYMILASTGVDVKKSFSFYFVVVLLIVNISMILLIIKQNNLLKSTFNLFDESFNINSKLSYTKSKASDTKLEPKVSEVMESKSPEKSNLEKFLSQLEKGEWVVITGSYKKKEAAIIEIERIKSIYPELFKIYSEIQHQYYDNNGEGIYYDGKHYAIYLGGFYSYSSAQLLREKLIREIGIDDAFVKSPLGNDSLNIAYKTSGWVYIGTYDINHNIIISNIHSYPAVNQKHKFINKNQAYNIRSNPPDEVDTYYDDLKITGKIGRIREGDSFIIKKVKEYIMNDKTIKVWAEIETVKE